MGRRPVDVHAKTAGLVLLAPDDLNRVRRVKAKPLRGRCASPDTTATVRGMAAARRTGQVQATVPASSKPSSNAAEPSRTAPHQPRLITAGPADRRDGF